ncbi:VOC family protein [Fulvivirgaceae bacterium PWU4]|uniref:VOC family protein n=1 Tax=Chryseosolibacter histidini TaxID=2782349 RepID=A0AAP2GQL0_9BACT|nr:VOC family protein [Chryseosolibacter histidini]MBT1698647.1 VOC family protein [Chryseosolibacter histidini]
MITRLSHYSIYVLDQDQAYDFYVNKLGFEVVTDATMDNGFRWLTVKPKQQQNTEIVLMPVRAGQMFDEQTAEQMRDLIRKGKLGSGVFETNDCRATYAELKAKGVEFMSEPKEQFYGVEALFKDNSGNWFSLTEHPKQ